MTRSPGTSTAVGGGTPPRGVGMNAAWRGVLDGLEHAFQPIVQLRGGRCLGWEALVRGMNPDAFTGPRAMFDAAWGLGVLAEVETALLAAAVARFRKMEGRNGVKLFLNVDARVLGVVSPPLDSGLDITVEFTERVDHRSAAEVEGIVERLRRDRIGIALDDFGVGRAGLNLLCDAKPDYIKVNRDLIAGIVTDHGRRAVTQHLIHSAHAMGVMTVAEGIETEVEFYCCRDMGFDFGQGYLLARPRIDLPALDPRSQVVEELNRNDRRKNTDDRLGIEEMVERLPALPVTMPKTELLKYFSGADAPAVAPVVDEYRRPLGMVRERDLKRYTYSRFGGELLRNKEVGHNLSDLVTKAPVCEMSTPLDQVIEAFSEESANDGIIIIEGGEYVGFLATGALLRLVHEQNLSAAADQNPLTKLPGNSAIVRRIQETLDDTDRAHVLVYFDFDNFKPFNDAFGFRQGDRAILMFADRLKAAARDSGIFAGHIGGDDFFLHLSGMEETEARPLLSDLIETFRSDAETLYDPTTREAGFLVGKDRDGRPRTFPLLTVTATAVLIPAGTRGLTPDEVNVAFAERKSECKHGAERLHFFSIFNSRAFQARESEMEVA